MKKNTILKSAPFFWYGKNLLSKIIGYLLWPFACVYCIIVMLRRVCYRYNLCKIHRLNVPVIVVGNITVGGTGKTPLVIWLADFLRQQGFRPGIISRGYGRKSSGVYIVNAAGSPIVVGDEAVLIAKRTGCSMVIGEDRVAAAQKLLANTKCNVVVSDDGLQHLALGRDVEIAVLDGARNLGNGLCLPAGPLREAAGRLQDVDFVVKNIRTKERKQTAGDAQYYTMQFIPECFCQLSGGKEHKELCDFISALQGKTCHAVAGIGNPVRFFQQLCDLGLQIQEHVFPDHHVFTMQDFVFADDEAVIIMTEKDAVKCQDFAKENWWYLRINAQPSDEFVDKLRLLLHVLF